MTEALRAPRGLAMPRPTTARPVAGAAIPASKAAARKAIDTKRPYHVGVFLGVSAGLYAVSLAGVTALQASTDGAAIAERQPAAAAVDALSTAHDDLDRRLAAGGSAYESAAAGYQRTADALAALERQLDALAVSVGKVDGVASSLPARVALPTLPRMVQGTAAAPVVHATTGASGKP